MNNQQPWKLSVAGGGIIASGSGNRQVEWDGKINGSIPQDGQYVLRVEDASETPSAFPGDTEIIIDGTPPTISNFSATLGQYDKRLVRLHGTITDSGVGVDWKTFRTNVTDGYLKELGGEGGLNNQVPGAIDWFVYLLTPEEYEELYNPQPTPTPTPTPTQDPWGDPWGNGGWDPGYGGLGYRVASLTVPRNEAVHIVVADLLGNVYGEAPKLQLSLTNSYAFSPNYDESQDTAQISIKATGPWTLSVVDKGQVTSGSGDATVTWDGKINGTLLPDAKYTLRLEAPDGSSAPGESQIIVDTVPPVVQTVGIVPSGTIDDGHSYRYTAVITDDRSGINWDTTRIETAGPTAVRNAQLSIDKFAGQLMYSGQFFEDSDELLAYSYGGQSSVTSSAYRIANIPGIGDISSGDRYISDIIALPMDMAGNGTDAFKKVLTSLTLSRNNVRPLTDGEYTYKDYTNAAKTVATAIVTNGRGERVAGAKVFFYTSRVGSTGGHNNPVEANRGPAGSLSTTNIFPGPKLAKEDYVGSRHSKLAAITDDNGVATVNYLPYGFAGEETLFAYLPWNTLNNTRVARVQVGLDNLVSALLEPGQLEIGDISSHTSGYYGTDITVKRMTNAGRLLRDKLGAGFRINGVALPYGGPFDITHSWGFTNLNKNAHRSHREGKNTDFSLVLTDGVRRTWLDDDVWATIKRAGGRDPIDEAGELIGRGTNSHWHINWMQTLRKGEAL